MPASLGLAPELMRARVREQTRLRVARYRARRAQGAVTGSVTRTVTPCNVTGPSVQEWEAGLVTGRVTPLPSRALPSPGSVGRHPAAAARAPARTPEAVPAPPPPPPSLARFAGALEALPGFSPSEPLWVAVLERFADMDLDVEAAKMAIWSASHNGVRCTGAWVLRWLQREREAKEAKGHRPNGPYVPPRALQRGPSVEETVGEIPEHLRRPPSPEEHAQWRALMAAAAGKEWRTP